MTHDLEFKWGTSRGVDTYGYALCSLYVDGKRVARCNGGGYDMKGTCFGDYLAGAYADRLRALKEADMPAQSHWDGERRVSDGNAFYGLRFIDPKYDPGKAVIGADCSDRTLAPAGAVGQTVEQAESQGVSFGLERLQAAYQQSSPFASERHTIPCIDGACGMSSVEKIAAAIGLTLEYVPGRKNRRNDLYRMHDNAE